MNKLTNDDKEFLDDVRQCEKRASYGVWRTVGDTGSFLINRITYQLNDPSSVTEQQRQDDAHFITSARHHIPKLLGLIERLTAETTVEKAEGDGDAISHIMAGRWRGHIRDSDE